MTTACASFGLGSKPLPLLARGCRHWEEKPVTSKTTVGGPRLRSRVNKRMRIPLPEEAGTSYPATSGRHSPTRPHAHTCIVRHAWKFKRSGKHVQSWTEAYLQEGLRIPPIYGIAVFENVCAIHDKQKGSEIRLDAKDSMAQASVVSLV